MMPLHEELQNAPPAMLAVDHVTKIYRGNRQTVV